MGGWSTGAQANTSTVLRWTVWSLLLLGPLLAGAALLSAPAGTTTPAPPAPAAPATAGSQGSAGFASLFVDAYLRAGRETRKNSPRSTRPHPTSASKESPTSAPARSSPW